MPPAASAAGSRERSLPVPYDLQEAVEEASILGTHLFLLDAATARVQVTDDITHELFRGRHFNLHDRFKKVGICILGCCG